LRSNPNQVNAWLGMALLAQRLGNVEGEINALAHLLTLQPSAQGYLQLGTWLAQANHRAEALAAYQQALRIAPDLNEAREAAEELQR
jgi:tetratricopeptide (TPR) repeat protein